MDGGGDEISGRRSNRSVGRRQRVAPERTRVLLLGPGFMLSFIGVINHFFYFVLLASDAGRVQHNFTTTHLGLKLYQTCGQIINSTHTHIFHSIIFGVVGAISSACV